jgi:hypothetical protein
LGRHAVVIGGSIGGLLAARVLSGHFEQITVVERDPAPEGAEPRKGVPQGKHVHALFGGGVAVLERLYPGIFEELVAAGAVACDFARDLRWYHQGVWKLRTESGLRSFWQTRPFLEAHVRRRTAAAPGVRCLNRCEAVRLLSDAAGRRVTSVEVRHRGPARRPSSRGRDRQGQSGHRFLTVAAPLRPAAWEGGKARRRSYGSAQKLTVPVVTSHKAPGGRLVLSKSPTGEPVTIVKTSPGFPP